MGIALFLQHQRRRSARQCDWLVSNAARWAPCVPWVGRSMLMLLAQFAQVLVSAYSFVHIPTCVTSLSSHPCTLLLSRTSCKHPPTCHLQLRARSKLEVCTIVAVFTCPTHTSGVTLRQTNLGQRPLRCRLIVSLQPAWEWSG